MLVQSIEKIVNDYKRTQKEWEMRCWKYDIESYNNTKKMREIAHNAGRNTEWYDKRMKEICNRWPNVKNWD